MTWPGLGYGQVCAGTAERVRANVRLIKGLLLELSIGLG